MSCYHPIKGYRTSSGVVFSELSRYDILGDIEIACGQCIGCRMRRASDWELRVMHEASLHERNCFVTLTYGRGQLPVNASLDHGHVQLFMKRLRVCQDAQLLRDGPAIRFYMCGEYGPRGGRPHYHVCLFGCDFADAKEVGKSKSGHLMYKSGLLEKLWGRGICTVQPLVRETASYAARYIMKKALGPEADKAYEVVTADGEILQRKAEYSAMSLRPGIGARWFAKFGSDVFPRDMVVSDGVKRRVPRYYDKLFKRSGDVRLDRVEFARQERAKLAAADNTDDRRAVREKVHLAKVRTLTRGDSDELCE